MVLRIMAVTSRKNLLDKRLPYVHRQMLFLQSAAILRKGMMPQDSNGGIPLTCRSAGGLSALSGICLVAVCRADR